MRRFVYRTANGPCSVLQASASDVLERVLATEEGRQLLLAIGPDVDRLQRRTKRKRLMLKAVMAIAAQVVEETVEHNNELAFPSGMLTLSVRRIGGVRDGVHRLVLEVGHKLTNNVLNFFRGGWTPRVWIGQSAYDRMQLLSSTTMYRRWKLTITRRS